MGARGRRLGWRFAAGACISLVVVVACIAFVQRELVGVHIRTYWYVHSKGEQAELFAWLDEHRDVVLPVLVGYFRKSDPVVCGRAGELARGLLKKHSEPTDPDDFHLSLSIIASLEESLGDLPTTGRREAVQIAYDQVSRNLGSWSPNIATVLDSAGELILAALSDRESKVVVEALSRAGELWNATAPQGVAAPLVAEWKKRAYSEVASHLYSKNAAVRAAAVSALAKAPNHEHDSQLIALLGDEDLLVQRGALLALAEGNDVRLANPERKALIPFLNARDPELVLLATRILQREGVPAEKIEVARLSSAVDPQQRVKAVEKAALLDLTTTLLQLSNDDDPAVRLAFARAAAPRKKDEQLRARVKELALRDPVESVRAECGSLLKR